MISFWFSSSSFPSSSCLSIATRVATRRPAAVSAGTPCSGRDPRPVDPYQLPAALGRGGLGAVFLGQHEVLGVIRAINVME